MRICILFFLIIGIAAPSNVTINSSDRRPKPIILRNSSEARNDVLPQVEKCEAEIRLHPDSAQAHFELGMAYLSYQFEKKKAIRAFEDAVRLNPEYAEAYNGLGWVCLTSGPIVSLWVYQTDVDEWRKAIKAFEKAVWLKRDFADAHLGLGEAYRRLSRDIESLNELQEAIRLNPDGAYAWKQLSHTYESLERYDDAIKAFKQSIDLRQAHGMQDETSCSNLVLLRVNENFLSHIEMGRLYEKNGQVDEAVTCYEQAKAMDPFEPMAYHHLALTLFAAGQRDAAFIQYNLLLSLCRSGDEWGVCQHYADDLTHRLQW